MGKQAEVEPLSAVLKRAGKKALGGGLAGALAMVAQVGLLMWMRTTMNYQHANGLSTMEAISALYAMGGLARLYQGWQAALLQAPLSRFGDTAANAGVLAVLSGVGWMPEGLKTFFASWAAAGFRILITPVDALKTTLQVQGSAGLTILADRVAKEALTYMATISAIIAEDGVQGLFLRGLGTKLLTNGVSAMLFSVLWKYFEQLLTAKKEDPKKGQ
ncbi:hypothetical protein EMIHUDRAFT_457279 [Emiliania huxleyi CCMP1516]|uniref:Uncharacterized protein n=2 Tax=Emiliania huxleyi TaxID=2903 RepID=A0A0D3JTK5_EMIH1|nr:hypothetical protein EMIHUDRAFT_457279 [Emiliania huxleyi CCMP1516]EOD26840.1 hypothetical protein EMIHUDRAFT_457279 [Emiliania huxleyi CCMP1516]|eukprot:XP_005779269.1 hypothetical protein EMIHUDRAFT_457279 [Emiliania huxleyi CCMP1516]